MPRCIPTDQTHLFQQRENNMRNISYKTNKSPPTGRPYYRDLVTPDYCSSTNDTVIQVINSPSTVYQRCRLQADRPKKD